MKKELNVSERMALASLRDAWNKYIELVEYSSDDTNDFRKAIHDAQRIIISRPFLRDGAISIDFEVSK